MARDVELDIIANDRTAAGTSSARRNLDKVDDGLKKVSKSGDDTDRSMQRMAKSAERSSSMMTTLGAKLLGAGGAVAGIVAFKVVADALAGSVLLGLGAALTAVAIKAQSMTVGVRTAFAGLADHVKTTSVQMSSAFGPALVKIASIARNTFDNLVPDLTIAFRKMAPAVQRFAGDLGKALMNLRPALQPLADGFVRLLAAAGPALQNAMHSVAQGLISIGDEMNRRPEAFANFIENMGKLAEVTLKTGAFLNDFGHKFMLNLELIGKAGAGRMAELAGNTKGANEAFASARDIVAQLNPPLHTATQSMATLSDGEQVLVEQAKAATDALNNQQHALLSNSDASIAMEQAIDDAAKAVKGSKKTLDLNTQAGRDNQRVLNQVAEATLAARDASVAAGDASSVTAGKVARGRKAWVDLQVQFGTNRRLANEMADAIFGVPTKRNTKITADADSAIEAARAAKSAIDAVHSKTVFINAVRTGAYNDNTSGRFPTRAAGGPVTRGTTYLVGEQGPELFTAQQSGRIIPTSRTQRSLGQRLAELGAGWPSQISNLGRPGPTAGPTVINIALSAPNYIGSRDELKRALSDLGRQGHLTGPLRAAGVRLT